MIKFPPKKNKKQKQKQKKQNNKKKLKFRWAVLHKKQLVCGSDHKTAKIFVKGLDFS